MLRSQTMCAKAATSIAMSRRTRAGQPANTNWTVPSEMVARMRDVVWINGRFTRIRLANTNSQPHIKPSPILPKETTKFGLQKIHNRLETA